MDHTKKEELTDDELMLDIICRMNGRTWSVTGEGTYTSCYSPEGTDRYFGSSAEELIEWEIGISVFPIRK